MDKVTTDEELEEMLHRDNLAIFISDVSGISFSSGPQKMAMQLLVKVTVVFFFYMQLGCDMKLF